MSRSTPVAVEPTATRRRRNEPADGSSEKAGSRLWGSLFRRGQRQLVGI